MSCRTCKWLDVPPDKINRDGSVRKTLDHNMFRCLVPFEMPPIPASYTSYFGYTPPTRRMMCPAYGDDCPAHELRP
jgi:hypothetical protein